MNNLRQSLEQHLVALAWSLWTELGIPGVANNHSTCAIDPEALLAYTALLGDLDPRLRDLAADWSKLYGRYIAMSRLRSLHRTLGDGSVTSGKVLMPIPHEPSNPRSSRSKKKHIALVWDRPAAFILRCRTLFGVSARADILAHLVFAPRQGVTAAHLAKRISLTKLNVAQVLNDLRTAGVCTVERQRNTDVYHLVRAKELHKLMAPLPSRFPLWDEVFALLLTCWKMTKTSSDQSPRVAAIGANKTLSPWWPALKRAGITVPADNPNLDVYWRDVGAWCIRTSAALASGTSPLLTTRP